MIQLPMKRKMKRNEEYEATNKSSKFESYTLRLCIPCTVRPRQLVLSGLERISEKKKEKRKLHGSRRERARVLPTLSRFINDAQGAREPPSGSFQSLIKRLLSLLCSAVRTMLSPHHFRTTKAVFVARLIWQRACLRSILAGLQY